MDVALVLLAIAVALVVGVTIDRLDSSGRAEHARRLDLLAATMLVCALPGFLLDDEEPLVKVLLAIGLAGMLTELVRFALQAIRRTGG